ncbi:hypothetical protein P4H66_23365 [Paenibacillus dokdonensis]|uniref:HNH endonuclease 5 domain-containing protein n=1 Tax=Paenibacillus dokdonensis TaxID=2567944 RepID=A0ABU6GSQ9_9BACL|nr:hypothetical protein [Paenibacillus dokdonensis]MEC0242754.1 hypothetical protein [Paenibacillus dokdonensis]
MARNVTGTCHICGNYGKLTFEHVPPKKAFNDRPIIRGVFEKFQNMTPGEKVQGKIEQKGSGGHTLCPKCNNDTGSYYGSDFIEWTYQNYYLIKTLSEIESNYTYKIYPLRVIKQIITMFFSTNGDAFRKAHPDLVKFVLDQNMKYLKPSIRIFTFLVDGEYSRHTGIVSSGNIVTGKITVMSEIAIFPVGYLMTINSDPPDERLTEITHFSRYGYDDLQQISLNMNKLPISYFLPGDYRTRDEIMEDYYRNIEDGLSTDFF